jgi:hypothetical protein
MAIPACFVSNRLSGVDAVCQSPFCYFLFRIYVYLREDVNCRESAPSIHRFPMRQISQEEDSDQILKNWQIKDIGLQVSPEKPT